MEHQQSLAELMVSEQGKPLKEALVEVAYAASFIQWFSEQAKRANGEIIPSAKEGARILATREPIGVVAAITPWNFRSRCSPANWGQHWPPVVPG